MIQPSPTEQGFNPQTKEWKTNEGKDFYRKQVTTFAKYISYFQNKKHKQTDVFKIVKKEDLIEIQIAHLHTKKDGYEKYETEKYFIENVNYNEILLYKKDDVFTKLKISIKDLKNEFIRVLKINDLIFDAPYFR